VHLAELQDGDIIGFGGPDTIIACRSQVANPFLFKFYGSQEAADAAAAAEDESVGTQEDHVMSSTERPVSKAPATRVRLVSVPHPKACLPKSACVGAHGQMRPEPFAEHPVHAAGYFCALHSGRITICARPISPAASGAGPCN